MDPTIWEPKLLMVMTVEVINAVIVVVYRMSLTQHRRCGAVVKR